MQFQSILLGKIHRFYSLQNLTPSLDIPCLILRYNEKKRCVSLDVIIIEDNTNYGDTHISNLCEKFKVYCLKDTDEDDVEKYSPNDKIEFISIGNCSVWGDYASNLSY